MKKIYSFLFMTCILSCLSFAGYSQTTTYTFNGTIGFNSAGINGTPQAYVVPAGVTSIGVDMYGGCGGYACCMTNPVANGGRVQCTMNVTPGTTLWVYVGGAGGNSVDAVNSAPGGWNGGGTGGAPTSAFCASGGGATDIRTINYVTTPSSVYPAGVLVVAGAGGGGGDFQPQGGMGGGLTGGNGQAYPSLSTVGGACGGGQTGPACTTGSVMGTAGQGASTGAYSEGGGGGGWWGGNGGTSDAAGGGGSSYPPAPNATVAAIVHTQGYSAAIGNGQVVITVLCGSPGSIVGNSTICTGTTSPYTNPTGASAGTWSSSNPAAATINPVTGVLTGVAVGVTTLLYTVSNPCGGVGALATKVVTVSQSPSFTTSSPVICTGGTNFAATPAAGVWSSSNTIAAAISASGFATGLVVGGTTNIVYTLPSGCFASIAATVNLGPNLNIVTQTGSGFCAGNPFIHIGLNGSTAGATYSLYSGPTLATTVPGTGSPLDFGLITAPGTYTVIGAGPTGCTTTMVGAATIFLNPNPSPITGASSLCAGATAALTSTPLGGTWTSGNISAATVNASSGVVSGVSANTLNITYTLTGGCNVSKTITVNAVPAAITGNTNICPGTSTTLNSATTGGTWSSSSPLLATAGIGSGVISGVSAGNPTISYILGTGCVTTTPVVVNLLPAAYLVTGGGGYCGTSGVHIGLSYSSSGVNYELFDGATLMGTTAGSNSGLDFGLQTTTGTYTVFAINPITNCSQTMSGSTVVFNNPLPTTSYVVGGGGSYCAGGTGVPVTLSHSDFGTLYQLMNGAPAGSALPGTGGPLSFGLQTVSGAYTVVATTAAGCTGTMTTSAIVSVNNLPTAYTVSGGGNYCASGTGADIVISGSDPGVVYHLFDGATGLVSITGTGSSIDFGLQTAAGFYTVVATDPTTTCSGNMSGSAVITILPLPTTV